MKKETITIELLKEWFRYDDGELFWIKSPIKHREVLGKSAGHLTVSPKGYKLWLIGFRGKSYRRSRLVFFYHHGFMPTLVDHINKNPLDDRIENLRAANYMENACNTIKKMKASSKYKGVTHHNSKYWQAHISSRGKYYHLGTFKTEQECALAYNKAAVKYHGEFATINIIQP